jgi:hypothetical protein
MSVSQQRALFRSGARHFLQRKQNLSALCQQLAGRRSELAQVTASLEQLPTVVAENVQASRNLSPTASSASPRSRDAAPRTDHHGANA